MFRNYREEGYIHGIEEQHNIMVFVGNGFDISVLKKYRNDDVISSYSKFYDYLCYKGFDADNMLFKRMRADKDAKKENWSDFECSLGELLQDGVSTKELDSALKEIQKMFLLFLNEVVTPEVLLSLSNDSAENEWGKNALSKFWADLDKEDYEKIKFLEGTYHHDMYSFLFVNFNYTSLFDNYIFLDKYQFDPNPHKSIGTNISIYPNPNGYTKKGMDEKTEWSSFIMTDIIHPHGYQNIPRSLLFGIENAEYELNKELNKFNKSYWAQNNKKYKSYFDNVKLFIIYGASIGESDSWWWKNIYDSLQKSDSELIIYYYNDCGYTKEDVKERFIVGCKVQATKDEILKIKEKIYVVLYNSESDIKMFGLKNGTSL